MGHAYKGDEHLRKVLLVETEGQRGGSGWGRRVLGSPRVH